MDDHVIIGGGVIGLSIARELAGRGARVRVVSRSFGRDTASWAAAGIFPPAPEAPDDGPADRLTAFSDRLHVRWAAELLDETGIDNELQRVGGLHVAASDAALGRLAAARDTWQTRGVRCTWLDAGSIEPLEPGLGPAVADGGVRGGLYLPDEATLRPPRHLEALAASCRRRGVAFTSAATRSIEVTGDRIAGVVTEAGRVRGGSYCFAAGAWAGGILASLGLTLETRPIRGQILLLRLPRPVLGRVVNFGIDYLVPRADGRLLVGSTLEDAGFDATTTPDAVVRLRAVAGRLLGPLPGAEVERAWAGLRPGSADGLPSLGAIPGVANGFVAAGHFRAGLHQSPGTAVLLADLLTGGRPAFDVAAFSPARAVGDDAAPGSVADYLRRAVETAA